MSRWLCLKLVAKVDVSGFGVLKLGARMQPWISLHVTLVALTTRFKRGLCYMFSGATQHKFLCAYESFQKWTLLHVTPSGGFWCSGAVRAARMQPCTLLLVTLVVLTTRFKSGLCCMSLLTVGSGVQQPHTPHACNPALCCLSR